MQASIPTRDPSRPDAQGERASLGAVLYSIYAWMVFFLCIVIGLPIIGLTLALSSRPVAFRLGSWIFRTCLSLVGIRVSLSGIENAEPGKPHLLMGNHVSYLDGFVLPAGLPFPPLAVEKRENFSVPVYGWFIRKWGNIPIARQDRAQAIKDMESAKAYLTGHPDAWIVVMPEGTRSQDGTLGPFKKGGFHLALATGASIVPYTLVGAYDVQHKGSWLVHPGHIELVLHPAIDPTEFGPERFQDLMEAVRTAIQSGLPPSQ